MVHYALALTRRLDTAHGSGYTLLSLAPPIILMMAMAGLVFPRATVQSELILPVRDLMGSQAAKLVAAVFDNAKTATGFLAGALSVIMLLIGASGVFLELRDSLDTVWGVKPRYGSGLISLIRERLFAPSVPTLMRQFSWS